VAGVEDTICGLETCQGQLAKSTLASCALASFYVNVTNTKSKSGHAQAIVTFEDLELALAAFERLLWSKSDHGHGQMHWPSVKWFKCHGKHR
jgi:hypothetical protein